MGLAVIAAIGASLMPVLRRHRGVPLTDAQPA
jgi:hypothetical protein